MCLEKYWELSWILLILFWILWGKIARASILVSMTIFDMNLIWTQTPQSHDFQTFKSLDVLISMFSWSLSYTIEVSRHLQDLYSIPMLNTKTIGQGLFDISIIFCYSALLSRFLKIFCSYRCKRCHFKALQFVTEWFLIRIG